jgi:hypothetical protein
MSIKGTDSYAGAAALPGIVAAAVALARDMGFPSVCRVAQGRLLMTDWPSTHAGALDEARLTWLEHRALLATEVRVAPDLSTIIATRRP